MGYNQAVCRDESRGRRKVSINTDYFEACVLHTETTLHFVVGVIADKFCECRLI